MRIWIAMAAFTYVFSNEMDDTSDIKCKGEQIFRFVFALLLWPVMLGIDLADALRTKKGD